MNILSSYDGIINYGIIFLFECAVLLLYLLFKLISTKNDKSKCNKLYKRSIIIFILGIAVFFSSTLYSFITISDFNKNTFTTYTDYEINNYNIKIDVLENSKIIVKERFQVDFKNTTDKSIYKYIPEYVSDNNKLNIRKINIKNIKTNTKYKIIKDRDSGKKLIKIDNNSQDNNYELEYTYYLNNKYKNYNKFDCFIFDYFSNGSISNGESISINMPKEFNKNNIMLNKNINYYIEDNTIYTKLDKNNVNNINNNLILSINLPRNYFKDNINMYSIFTFIIILFLIIEILFVIYLFLKSILIRSDNNSTNINDKLSPIEIFYLYNNYNNYNKRDFYITLLLSLLSKNIIKLNRRDNDLYVFKVNKYFDLDSYINREVKVIKLKEFKCNLANLYNFSFYKEYLNDFSNGKNEIIIRDKIDDFYRYTKYFVDNGYIKIVSDSIDSYDKEELNKLILKRDSINNSIDSLMNEYELKFYEKFFEGIDEKRIYHDQFYDLSISDTVDLLIKKYNKDVLYDLGCFKCLYIISFLYFIISILFIFNFNMLFGINNYLYYTYLISYIYMIIIPIISLLINKKNSYYKNILFNFKSLKEKVKNSDISTCNNDLVLAYVFSKDFKIINNCDETKDLVNF